MSRRPDPTPRTPQKHQTAHPKPQRNLSLKPQQRIGPYLVSKTLGIGSTGHVKLGTHFQTAHTVAIKFIPKPTLATQDLKQQQLKKKLEREITIMKIIKHPNVLQLLDVYETDSELLLVLEHVQGGELFDYIVQRGRLTESEALKFFQQIISGVNFVHQHKICHRDLKPENLLIDQYLNIKIADFGMANSQSSGRMLETSCGSPHYASPEIIKGVQYNGNESDIWSCGIILYALLTGNLPFDDENIRRLLSKVKSGVFMIPSYVNAQAQSLIRQMLTVETQYRISMDGVMADPWFNSQAPRHCGEQSNPRLEHLQSSYPIFEIDQSIVDQLFTLGYTVEETLEAIRSERYRQSSPALFFSQCIEKVIYRSLLDDKNQTAMTGVEDECHQLPESPKRRSQYQQDIIERQLLESQKLVIPKSNNRALSGNFFWGGKQPYDSHWLALFCRLMNQDSSSTMNEDLLNASSGAGMIVDHQMLNDTPMYQTPDRSHATLQSPSKKSWFNTIFHARSDTHTLHLTKPLHCNLTDFKNTCDRLRVRYQIVETRSKAVLKCKTSSDDDMTIVCKFRIDISESKALISFQHGNQELFEQCIHDLDALMR